MTLNFIDNKVQEVNGRKINLFGENLKVKSSMIKNITYHPFTSILQIEFSAGLFYAYFSVPQDVYLQLASAESKGKSFHSLIKDKFQYKQIKG